MLAKMIVKLAYWGSRSLPFNDKGKKEGLQDDTESSERCFSSSKASDSGSTAAPTAELFPTRRIISLRREAN
jgi:hypothetical protein